MKLTRRKLAAVLVSATAMAAQQPAPAPAGTPAPDDLLKAARDRLLANAAALASTSIPMATEPAFQFKA
jgi:hypothetical protein